MEKDLQKRSREIIEKINIEVVYIDRNDYTEHPSTYRWRLIYDFLLKNQGRFRKIMFADTRDTAFQGDPFLKVKENKFYSAKEGVKIASDGWNTDWIKDCFGRSMISKIGHNEIVCSGISLGGFAPVMEYLEYFIKILDGKDFSKCERNGVDQGIHNVIMYDYDLKGLELITLNEGFILNLQNWKRTLHLFDEISNSVGPFPIVHQYDRNQDLQKFYLDKYVNWDMEQDDIEICNKFSIQKDMDLFYRQCDIGMCGGISIQTCCLQCERNKDCGGFAFTNNQCWLKGNGNCESKHKDQGVISGKLID